MFQVMQDIYSLPMFINSAPHPMLDLLFLQWQLCKTLMNPKTLNKESCKHTVARYFFSALKCMLILSWTLSKGIVTLPKCETSEAELEEQPRSPGFSSLV